MSDQFRPPRQRTLEEKETITSFANWKSNLLYHLSLNNEFALFLNSEWKAKPTVNRGLIDDDNTITEVSRKTGVQKVIVLERMLGLNWSSESDCT